MATAQEKAQCVLWLAETKSPKTVQRKFRLMYHRNPPSVPSIYAWMQKFKDTGNVEHATNYGRPSTSEESVERIRESFSRSPRKSVRSAARQLALPKSTIHDVLHKRLRLRAYKMQLLQALKADDKPRRFHFACTLLEKIEEDENYLNRVCFTDESTFHVSGKVHRHNVRIWGSENPHISVEHERDSPKVNVWCGLLHDAVIGPFFFVEKTINGDVYRDLLELYVIPQLEHLQPNVLFQQDGAPPHWTRPVRELLDRVFPERWIGRGGPIPWPPRSPDITPLDFFLWGYVKDIVYQTPVSDISVLKERIQLAILTVTPQMLKNTWQEIQYRLDILRATKGAHVELH